MSYKMEPAYEYDLWEARREARYAAMTRGMRCRDCIWCHDPADYGIKGEKVGWCEDGEEFVYLDELVNHKGCETFDRC